MADPDELKSNHKRAYYRGSRLGYGCEGNREGSAQRTGRTFFVPALRRYPRVSHPSGAARPVHLERAPEKRSKRFHRHGNIFTD